MSLSSGARIGSYEIVAAVGAGGMGEVYRSRDVRLQRFAAIKVIKPDAADDEPAGKFRYTRLLAAISWTRLEPGLRQSQPSAQMVQN